MIFCLENNKIFGYNEISKKIIINLKLKIYYG